MEVIALIVVCYFVYWWLKQEKKWDQKRKQDEIERFKRGEEASRQFLRDQRNQEIADDARKRQKEAVRKQKEEADKAISAIENFESKIVEVSACTVTTALALCEQILKIANSFDEDLQVKMLRPAANFEELFHSLEYNYLTNLPVAVPTL